MPVLVRLHRGRKTIDFSRSPRMPSVQPSGVFQHPVHGGRCHRDDILIEHYEAQPPVAFEGIFVVKVDDGLLFPVLQPPIPRNPPIVVVDLDVAAFPVVVLAGRESDPAKQLADGDLGAAVPVLDVVDDLISRIVGNPATF